LLLWVGVFIGRGADFEWEVSSPMEEGMSGERLVALSERLTDLNTKGFLVIRNDRIVHETYTKGHGRHAKHYTASMAKALVGGISAAVAIHDGLMSIEEKAARYVPAWREDPVKSQIKIKHLGSHTSGIQDAWVTEESAVGVDQGSFSGWEGQFWKWRAGGFDTPNDAFSLSRDRAPVLFHPGSSFHYSNPGIAMLSYVTTAALADHGKAVDIRTLLRDRVMRPIGVPDAQWSCGYGKTEMVDDLPLVASWGGGSYSANATARIARLMLHQGNWDGVQILSKAAVISVVSDAGTPHNGGIGWWSNAHGDLGKAPPDAFSGEGAGHQIVFVVPSLNLIAVRNGGLLRSDVEYHTALRQFLYDPLIDCIVDTPEVTDRPALPYPPSELINDALWAPKEEIQRTAKGSDNWPITWADDGHLYTAYGDGWGFEPRTEKKLSLGLARIEGDPGFFKGFNIRSSSGEFSGDGPNGKKASGMLMVNGVLYMCARNAGNSQLAWSEDHGKYWEWSDWKFAESFGAPTFLNVGQNHQNARDHFVYIYSQDADTAYDAADRMVMARVPSDRLTDRSAYEFFKGYDGRGGALWTHRLSDRGTVFSHPDMCYRSGISYNAGLKRYFWCQIHPDSPHPQGPRFEGGFGIYEASEPWGPWHTAYFTRQWDVGPGETAGFPPKWMSEDGRTMHLVFSGEDAFSVRRVTLK